MYHRPDSLPPALEKRNFDQSIGIEKLGNQFILHRTSDQDLRLVAHQLINQRRNEWSTKPSESIPRILHQVWTSKDPLPDTYARASHLLQQQHPNYRYMIWRPQEYEPLLEDLIGPQYDALPLPVIRDIVAAIVLYQHGGTAVDLDAECVQPITPLLSLGDCLIGFDPPFPHTKNGRRLFLSPAVLSAVPAHPLIKSYLAELIQRANQYLQNGAGTIHWLTVDALTETVAQQNDERQRLLLLGPSYFCPVNRTHIKHLEKVLEGEEKRSMIKKIFQTLHIISSPPYSDIARETVFVHMAGGRRREKAELYR